MIPGENGTVEPGNRLLNWVWYCCYAEDSPELTNIMTDVKGHRHRNTLPMGMMRDEIWSAQRVIAIKTLAPPFAELVTKTTKPFIAVINDCISQRASFFDGRLLLVGDALATMGPHAGMGTNQAASNAHLLEKLMAGSLSIDQWEEAVLSFALVNTLLSKLIGQYFLASFPVFFVTLLRYLFALASRSLANMSRSRL